MAPRANWKGFLRLSLVTCPVALYPATSESEKVSFNQLNRKTGHRIKYAKVDADTGEEVDNEDIVKGYKADTDTFIVRRPVRNRPHRSHQPEARRQTDHRESATSRRERRRPDGRAAQEHWKRLGGRVRGTEEANQKAAQGGGRAEGNADADRRQEAGERGRGEETGSQAAAQVGLASR